MNNRIGWLGSDTVRNKKGQALVEFILILPVVLILIFTTIDIFNLILKKNDLETKVSDQIKLIEKEKISVDDLKNTLDSGCEISLSKNDQYIEINVSKSYNWISPITKLILKENRISVKRVIPNE